ncbi:MAG: membrane protein insertion efficiency factor YidD [Syntrophales bacterium]
MARQSGIFRIRVALLVMVPIITASIGIAAPCLCMDEKPFAPWDFNNPSSDREETPAQETYISSCGYFLVQAIRFYQQYISPVIGDRCQMYPSCSSYAIEAIKKHGCLIGSVMTSDRLIHESNETDHAPLIEKEGDYGYYDPVSSNDFWWYKSSDGTASQPDGR